MDLENELTLRTEQDKLDVQREGPEDDITGHVIELGKLKELERTSKDADLKKILEIRKSLKNELTEKSSVLIATTGEKIVDFNQALTMLVLEDNPDKIVSRILQQIPEGFQIQDNNLGEVALSIRIWLTESAGNAVRHIGYRQENQNDITYNVDIFSKTLSDQDGKQFLQISMQDNGIGIDPKNLDIIGTKEFTTSNEHTKKTENIFAGGHGRFSFYYKTEIANPRGWNMEVKNREDGENGAIASLTIPLREDIKA